MTRKLTRRDFLSATLCTASTIALMNCPSIALAGEPSEWDYLTEDEIRFRIQIINKSYSVGELLSDEDAAFILRFGTKPNAPQTRGQEGRLNIRGSRYGNTISGTGSLYYREDGFWKTYGSDATIRVTAGSTPKSMKLTISCVTYGVLGEGGLVQTYNDSVSASCSNKSVFYCNPQDRFWATAVTYALSAKLDVTTASGNYFTLLAS